MKSLIEYRLDQDRLRVDNIYAKPDVRLFDANLISSRTDDGRHMPILDLDFPHHFEESSTEGHTHLYIDVPMSRIRWSILMWALWQAGVIELGHFVWSIRRGANFVRLPGVAKTDEENTKPSYGWFFKLREKPDA
jgi:hypothetical protein